MEPWTKRSAVPGKSRWMVNYSAIFGKVTLDGESFGGFPELRAKALRSRLRGHRVEPWTERSAVPEKLRWMVNCLAIFGKVTLDGESFGGFPELRAKALRSRLRGHRVEPWTKRSVVPEKSRWMVNRSAVFRNYGLKPFVHGSGATVWSRGRSEAQSRKITLNDELFGNFRKSHAGWGIVRWFPGTTG
ncbi:MAG: hypothetical protein Q4D98_09460 [Planctomycetia bacterium]|nr:hypothetical protein [Planctomycetia bacterium]